MTDIQNKLLEITNALKENNCTNDSLLNGHSGIAIFLAYVNKLYNDPILNNQMEISLQKSLELFEKENPKRGFAGGVAGVCWGMNHLVLQNKVDADISSIFEEIDQYVITTSENDLGVNYFDFLHGGLGAGIYFLDRLPEIKAKNHLSKTILSLYQNAIVSGNDVQWSNIHIKINDASENEEFNLGMAHGIPSIIWFISKCYENNIENEKCEFLLNGCVNWIIKQKLKKQSVSCYPSAIVNNIPVMDSRLAWCYGDLGIASCIWQAAKVLKNDNWKNEAIEIMLHASYRKDLLENRVIDAGICHGTAGIAHIFNRFYFETKLPVFKETANFWINETLKMASFDDGLAGFKCNQYDRGWVNTHGLLEGVAGIGLVLLSHITNEEPSWDRCLLLS